MNKNIMGGLFFAMVVIVAIGSYAGSQYQQRAEQAGHAKQVAQAEQRPHCATVNALMIQEFDAIIASGKFPTDAQQDSWRRLTSGCQEDK